MKAKKISPVMQRCLDVLKEHGRLIRYDGGFWNVPNCKLESCVVARCDVPRHPTIPNFGVQTLEALEARGLVKSNRKATSQYGEFTVEYILS